MTVLVTRPDESGMQLVEMLNNEGFSALHFPLFEITAGRELDLLPTKLAQLKDDDIVFAVSKSAVKFAAETLKNLGFPWRNRLQYFAVGQSSAAYFCAKSEQAVIYPIEQENSEALLNLPEMQQLKGKNVLILRGNGGRNLFPEQATLRGAKVEIVECYQRVALNYSDVERNAKVDEFKHAGVQTLIVTSAEILNALVNFIPKQEKPWLFRCQLVTLSQRMANLAQKCGWKSEQIFISPRADNASLVKTLTQTRN